MKKSAKVVECFGEGIPALGVFNRQKGKQPVENHQAVCDWKRKIP